MGFNNLIINMKMVNKKKIIIKVKFKNTHFEIH